MGLSSLMKGEIILNLLISGKIEDIDIDDCLNINIFSENKDISVEHRNLIKLAYPSKNPNRIILVSNILASNNIEHITKIINIFKVDARVKKFICYLLDMCEKWKFINIYNSLINELPLCLDDISNVDFVCDYVNNAYIFDFSTLKRLNNSIFKFNQCIFSSEFNETFSSTGTSTPLTKSYQYKKVDPSISSILISSPNSSGTSYYSGLVLLECLENYSPIIREVSNPTNFDLIVYNNVKINPFKLGQKIKIDYKEYTYKTCLDGGIYFKFPSNHEFLCLVIKTCGSFWTALFLEKDSTRISYKSKNMSNLNRYYTSNNVVCKSDFLVFDETSNVWTKFDPEPLVLSYRNSKNFDISYLSTKRKGQVYIGPCPVTSLSNWKMSCISFDLLKYYNAITNKYDKSSISKKYDILLRLVYNIPKQFVINYNNINIVKLIFSYPSNEFIKSNNYFECESIQILDPEIENLISYTPLWDLTKL